MSFAYTLKGPARRRSSGHDRTGPTCMCSGLTRLHRRERHHELPAFQLKGYFHTCGLAASSVAECKSRILRIAVCRLSNHP